MKVTLYTDELRAAPVELLAVGVFSDEADRGLAFAHLNRSLDGALEGACRDEDFRGNSGQTLLFNASDGVSAKRVLVYGYGEREKYTTEVARQFAGATARNAGRVGARTAALGLTIPDPAPPETQAVPLIRAISEGAFLGHYAFQTYITRERRPSSLQELRIAFVAEDVQGVKGSTLRAAIQRGQATAAGVAFARDLVNEPANVLTPEELGERVRRMAKEKNLAFRMLGQREIERQGMGLLLGVARGSEHEPRLLHLTYAPEGAAKDVRAVALVGKGLTFDAGGLSLKPTESMVTMKSDMAGAAAVAGAMMAVADLKPSCIVHGIIAAAENMPDGKAIRPSDILRSKKGLTVEVLDTDAEGRLVLADALTYAQEQGVKEVIDAATLTGGCMVALGKATGGAFCNDEEMAERLAVAWRRSGESFWRLPLDLELKETLKSEIADLRNLGTDRFGSAIVGALFLREFIEPDVRWAHLDIAGPVLSAREAGYLTKGATGFGVRTLLEYLDG